MKSLELEKMGLLEMNSDEMEKVEGGDKGYRPGITFGDSHWYGPTSGVGSEVDRPADWIDIYFGGASY